jgi:hypothetical protein
MRRAIDIHEGDTIDERAFKSLVRAAAALNESSRRTPSKAKPKKAAAKSKKAAAKPKKVTATGTRATATKRRAR